MTTMIIVRHGQSTGNVEGLYCGQLDFPLTQKGRAQAELAGAYFGEYMSQYSFGEYTNAHLGRKLRSEK